MSLCTVLCCLPHSVGTFKNDGHSKRQIYCGREQENIKGCTLHRLTDCLLSFVVWIWSSSLYRQPSKTSLALFSVTFRQFSVLYRLYSNLRFPSSVVVCHLSSVACHVPSCFCLLSVDFCFKLSVVCTLSVVIFRRTSASGFGILTYGFWLLASGF